MCNFSLAGNDAYEQGDIILGAAISFRYFVYYGGYSSASIPVLVSGEYGFHKYVSGGVFAGYQNYRYEDYYNQNKPPYSVNYTYSYSSISVGVKGSFHVFPFINDQFNTKVDASRMDAYATAYIGNTFIQYNTSSGYIRNDILKNRPIVGPGVGFRYTFTPMFGAFAEAGVGATGIATIGLALKL